MINQLNTIDIVIVHCVNTVIILYIHVHCNKDLLRFKIHN